MAKLLAQREKPLKLRRLKDNNRFNVNYSRLKSRACKTKRVGGAGKWLDSGQLSRDAWNRQVLQHLTSPPSGARQNQFTYRGPSETTGG